MSSLAMNENGDVATAWEFRDRFLSARERYTKFSCSLCGVLLHDRCIYTECKKAPHFYLPKGESHEHWCGPQEASIVGPVVSPSIVENSPRYRVLKRNVELPEALVRRRIRKFSFEVPGGLNPERVPAVEAERRANLMRSGDIPQRQTTSMLREVATAYDKVIEEVRTIAKEEGLPDAKQWELRSATLKDFPLNLYGDASNYSEAFRNPKGGIKTVERIYHGYSGRVGIDDGQLRITANEGYQSQSEAGNGAAQLASFFVLIPSQRRGEYALEIELRQLLIEAAEKRLRVRWFAYGLPVEIDRNALLKIESLADLHVAINRYRGA